MGKDSTSNILYILGIIGAIMVIIDVAYGLMFIDTILAEGPSLIGRFLTGGGYVLVGVGFIGLYRDHQSYIPLTVPIMWVLVQVIGMAIGPLFGGGRNYVTMAMYTVTFLLMGYSVYLFREPIGSFATLASIIFIIWAFGLFAVRAMDLTMTDPLIFMIDWSGFLVVFVIALIYFILLWRSESS
ncbi:MAG: hypothetical protein ACFFEW_13050 [Candidatus Thorarchaeota archaeon]